MEKQVKKESKLSKYKGAIAGAIYGATAPIAGALAVSGSHTDILSPNCTVSKLIDSYRYTNTDASILERAGFALTRATLLPTQAYEYLTNSDLIKDLSHNPSELALFIAGTIATFGLAGHLIHRGIRRLKESKLPSIE